MDKDIIQILWSALLIVIVTIVPLVKKFKEMQRKELRSASAAQPVRCLLYTSPSPRDCS